MPAYGARPRKKKGFRRIRPTRPLAAKDGEPDERGRRRIAPGRERQTPPGHAERGVPGQGYKPSGRTRAAPRARDTEGEGFRSVRREPSKRRRRDLKSEQSYLEQQKQRAND